MIRRRSFIRAHPLMMLGALLLAGLMGVGTYMAATGLPEAIERRVKEQFLRSGYELHMRRLRWHWRDGFQADDVQIYADPNTRRPFVEAARVRLDFDVWAWMHSRQGLKSIWIDNGTLCLESVAPPVLPESEKPGPLLAERVYAELSILNTGVVCRELRAEISGVPIHTWGVMNTSREETADDYAKPLTATALQEWMHHAVPRIQPFLSKDRMPVFEKPPRVDIHFELFVGDPARSSLDIHAEGSDIRVRGVPFHTWSLQAVWTEASLRISRMTFEREEGSLEVTGAVDLEAQTVEARLQSTLPAVFWNSLIPDAWRNGLAAVGLRWGSQLQIDVQCKPTPLDQLGRAFSGAINFRDAQFREVALAEGMVSFDWERPRLTLREINARIGRAEGQGPLQGAFTIDLETHTYSGQCRAGFDPHELLSVMSTNLTKVIRSIDLQGPPPEVDCAFSGIVGNHEAFWVNGTIKGQKALYRGAYADAVTLAVGLTNRVLTLSSVNATRGEGALNGFFRYDLARHRMWIRAHSTLPPAATLKCFGSSVENALRSVKADGPGVVDVEGVVDLLAPEKTDLRVAVDTRDLRYHSIHADHGAFTCLVKGRDIVVPDLNLDLYGGSCTGRLTFAVASNSAPATYTAALVWDEIDFAPFMVDWRQVDEDPYRGESSGWIQLSGLTDAERRDMLKGTGKVRLKDGYLFSVPLFGGLSKLLTLIYPGLGFSSQTQGRAPFEIRDGKVYTDDFLMEGALLSVKATGAYAFSEHLDFQVEVRPLGENLVAEWVRVLTFPVSKLLKFKLAGTLQDPQWSADNWPKDLFKMLDWTDNGEPASGRE